MLLISLAVMLVAGFDFRAPRDPRNVDLVLAQLVGWCFFDILGFSEHMDSTSYNVMDWVFATIVLLTLTLLVRAVLRASRPAAVPWRPLLNRNALAALAIALVALDVGVALGTPPDDAGYFVNIGAQRLRERGRWPYGDPLLTSTPAAAYGPLLYLAHIPFQFALAPHRVNPVSLPRPPIESGDVYFVPPLAATRLCTATFHLLAVGAL